MSEKIAFLSPGGSSHGVFLAAALSGLSARVPLLSGPLGRAIRGSALRRVAKDHGVRLSAEARRLLTRPARMLKARKRRKAFPRGSSGALRTVVQVSLLEHYFSLRDPSLGPTVFASEAQRVVHAMDVASEGLFADATGVALGRIKNQAADVAKFARSGQAVGRLMAPDREDRNPLERMVDQVMDTALIVPDELRRTLSAGFEEALRNVSTERPLQKEEERHG